MHFVASDARRRRSCLLGPTNSILEATTHLAWNLSMKMIENQLMGEVCKVQDDRTEVYKSINCFSKSSETTVNVTLDTLPNFASLSSSF